MSLWGDLMTANLSRSAWLFDLLQFGSFKGLTRKHRPSRGHSWRAIQDTHHIRGKPTSRLMLNGRLDSKSSQHNGWNLGYRVGDAATEKYGNDYEPSQHPNNTRLVVGIGCWGFDSLLNIGGTRLDQPPKRVRLLHQSYNTSRGVLLVETGRYFLLQSVDSNPLAGIDLTA